MLEWNVDPSIFEALMDNISGGKLVLDQEETNQMRNE